MNKARRSFLRKRNRARHYRPLDLDGFTHWFVPREHHCSMILTHYYAPAIVEQLNTKKVLLGSLRR